MGEKIYKYNKNFLTLSSALILHSLQSTFSDRHLQTNNQFCPGIAYLIIYLCFVFFFAVIFLCYDKVSLFGKVVLSFNFSWCLLMTSWADSQNKKTKTKSWCLLYLFTLWLYAIVFFFFKLYFVYWFLCFCFIAHRITVQVYNYYLVYNFLIKKKSL